MAEFFPPVTNLNELYKAIQPELDEVEVLLRQIGRSSNPLIAEINSYLFQKGGKRIRPALLLSCSRLFGAKNGDAVFWSAMVEVIHTASLIHDDIIDNSPLRRGQDTIHAKWGPNITVLLGDFLYIKAIAMALKTEHHHIIGILADVSAELVEGELIEYSWSGRTELTEPTYFEILNKKTAGLFAAACGIGGVLGNASAEEEAQLRDFGRNLGLAFQIIDDVLDFTGDEAELGKPVLSDLREGRITLPLVDTLGRADEVSRRELVELHQKPALGEGFRRTRFRHCPGQWGTRLRPRESRRILPTAKNILDRFPESESRAMLNRLADFILQRKK